MKDPEIALARAKRAGEIIHDRLFSEAVTAIKARLFSDFESSKWYERKVRDEVWRKMQALSAIERTLENEMKSGKIAEDLIKKEAARQVKLSKARGNG